jgi:hypothetical protein
MWIDEIERNTHTRIQAQTYFHLKDTKSLCKERKGQNSV